MKRKCKTLCKLSLFCFVVLSIGLFCNAVVISSNQGLMPIQQEHYDRLDSTPGIEPSTYLLYAASDKEYVNNYYLSDIIHLPIFDGFFSFGDILICFGFIGFIDFSLLAGMSLFINRKL